MKDAIAVEHVSKKYTLGQVSGGAMLRERLRELVLRPRRRCDAGEVLWALKDVTFRVAKGEVVGVIGRNGAGKSTLLKVLSKITYPTSGSVVVDGRTASLLEVGTGFHDELTGRENIYLNGSIMGMTRREIDARLEQIMAFAGVERFADTPIKRYSSGMRLRLGFAVAAHMDPEILLVDEVLAVGDAEFQKKCLKAMGDLRRGGRTVLFVSHNMAAVENLCPRTLWIDDGRVRKDGATADVIAAYMATFESAGQGAADLRTIETRTGTGDARLASVLMLGADGEPVGCVRSGDPVVVRVQFDVLRQIRDLHVGVEIRTDLGLLVTASNTWMTGLDALAVGPGEGSLDLEVDFLNLMPGRYYVTLWLKTPGIDYDVLENCVILDVETSNYYKTGRGISREFGLVFLPCRWRVNHLPS